MRTKVGTISSAKMQDTVTVTVHRSVFHPIYKKRYRVSKKFLADTAGQTLRVGDLVEIAECRPISKRKHFKVTQVLKAAPVVDELKEEAALEGVLNRSSSESSDSSDSSDSSHS